VVRDQAVFFEGGEARVDGARRRGVHTKETILEQAHQLIAVLGTLVEEFEQVQAQATVAEDAGHAVA